ncbi:E3 ubiquitin-protein ligase MPSR1 [Eucalyptus grandis]|uniref:E3 ubiquitin-protein ligase MPSR1 n=1 Tax=Eucalyptus grandis TaxID=71139 RepID=UPI00192E78FC|nr:E3 ubiquitin-protein ligase MPSR1 [Eucalyptus grandis]
MASSDAEQPPPPPPPEAPPGLPTPTHLSPTAQPSQENQNGERDPDPPRGRIILVNPLTQYMAVVDPSSPPPSSWEPLVRALRDGKGGGGPPASRESVRAMRDVVMKRTDERGGGGGEEEECAICMEELEEGREMPCRHRFHGGCIERWLGIHGTCPVCRYQMPADEGGAARKGWEEDDEGGEGGEEGRDIWIGYSVVRRDGSSDTDHHHHHHLHDRLHRHYSTDGA